MSHPHWYSHCTRSHDSGDGVQLTLPVQEVFFNEHAIFDEDTLEWYVAHHDGASNQVAFIIVGEDYLLEASPSSYLGHLSIRGGVSHPWFISPKVGAD